MTLSRRFREHFDRIMAPLLAEVCSVCVCVLMCQLFLVPRPQRAETEGLRGRKRRREGQPNLCTATTIVTPPPSPPPTDPRAGATGPSAAALKAYEDMNQFLSAFIERVRGAALCRGAVVPAVSGTAVPTPHRVF